MDDEKKIGLKSLFADDDCFSPSGSIEKIPLPRLFYFAKNSALDGILSIRFEDSKKIISFEGGNPRFVMSNIVSECLGRIFVAKGKISEAQCEESLSIMKKEKRKQGEILVTMGLLEPYQIDEALKEQARERVIELFAWKGGEYRFTPQMKLRTDLIPVDIDVSQIVLRGVRRYYDLDHLRKILDSWLDHIPLIQESELFPVESFKLATWEAKIVNSFDGKNSLRSVLNRRISREIDLYHVVFALASLNVLKFRDTDAERSEELEAHRKRRLEKLKSEFKRIRRKEDIIELTKDFVVTGEKKQRETGKRLSRSKIALAAVIIVVLSVILILSRSGRDFSKYAEPGVIKKGKFDDGVLTLVCEKGWNIGRDQKITRETMEKMYPQLKRDGFTKIKLKDKSGNNLGMIIGGKGDDYYLKVY
jgi:hypothetical protein